MSTKKTNPQTRYRSTFYWEGKQYEAASSKSQRDADKKAAIKLDKLRRGEIGISSNMTVKRWAQEWLETYKKGNVTDKVYQDYQRKIAFLTDSIGSFRLDTVTDIHVQKVINKFSGYSDYYVSSMMQIYKAMFRQAKISRLILFDPTEGIQKPKTTKGSHRSITDFEREHILKVADYHVAGLWVKTMLYCGLRPGETIPLQWKDIDFDKKRIRVSSAKESGSNRIKQPKTQAGIRVIPIPDILMEDFKKARGDVFEYVFTKQKSKTMHTAESLRCLWESFKKELDISMGAVYGKAMSKDGKMRKTLLVSVVAKDLTPYCMRHTYCTDLEAKGVPINIAKVLMGHSDISITANVYTHATEAAIDMAASLINGNNGSNDGNQSAES